MEYTGNREKEEQRLGRNKNTKINHTYINGGEYRRKFDMISDSNELNRLIYQLAKKMLVHRAGTKYEDMYWIDLDTYEIVAQELESPIEGKIIYSERTIAVVKSYTNNPDKRIMTIHTHPSSCPPSYNDFLSNFSNEYNLGIVLCHNGTVYMYSADEEYEEKYHDLIVAKYVKQGYNDIEAQICALKELQEKFDINFKEVMDYDNGR